MMSTRQASDDINLGIRQPEPLEKRARSSSPVKQRRPVQDWTSLTRSADGSLDRLFSTTSLSHDELMRFSKSQISEKLHISKSDYAIPIPFQIQFPPRLTAPSSPSARESSPKLVFTGHSYEPIVPDSPVTSTPDHGFHIQRPSSPEKPPSSIASRKKVSAFVKQSLADHSDQLSMIEEKSNASNSRASSSGPKGLPPIPPQESANELSHKKNPDEKERRRDPLLPNSESRTSLQRKPPPSDDQVHESSIVNPNLKATVGTPDNKHTEATRPPQSLKLRATESGVPGFSNITREPSPFQTSNRLPHSTAFQHNLNVANVEELKLGKRTFSDESQVSTVSSLNSFGDILNFEHIYMSSPNAKGEVRVSKYVTEMLGDAKAREKSPSPLVEQTNSSETNELSTSLHKLNEPKSLPSRNSEKESGDENISLGLETKPLRIGTSKSIELDTGDCSQAETKLTFDDNETEENFPDDNIGAGIGFHFPNNNSNSTNSDEAKSKVRSQRSRTRRSSRNSFFSDGKIEIPDLNDEHFWQGRLQEKCDWSEKEPEPIRALNVTKTHSKLTSDELSVDFDSDSSFNSQFSKRQSEKQRTTHMPASKSLASLTSSLSPVRHARHRSMYNIDFDYQSLAPPVPQHARSKSNATVGMSPKSSDVLNLAKNSRGFGNSIPDNRGNVFFSETRDRMHKKLPSVNDTENLKIHVNEPPKRVTYAVDFKTGDAAPETLPSFHIQRPSQDFYRNLPFQHNSRPGALSAKHTPESSDAGSSYNSSKTGRDTASTAPTEVDNVMIDLTKGNYDVHMVSRNDSTTSYRSRIEQMKDGKSVEVVLVEEEGDEDDHVDENDNDERDDLSSIYSRYLTSWDGKKRVRDRDQYFEPAIKNLSRKSSTYSEVSDTSEASGHSWGASSETNFQVKSLASIRREQAYQRKPIPVASKVPSGPCVGKFTSPKHVTNTHRDNSYFDYTLNDSYDFKSYMSQQVHK